MPPLNTFYVFAAKKLLFNSKEWAVTKFKISEPYEKNI
jgi:hypothetical protein